MLDQQPHMGILVVNHYLADEPRAFYGSDIKTPNVTEIAVYSAARDTATGEIIKQELLNKVEMSDFQFGLNIARPNFGDGNKVTQTFRKGYVTPVYDYEIDDTSDLVRNMAKMVEGGSDQVSRFINEAIAISTVASEKGRMSKVDDVQLKKITGMLQTYVINNETFYSEEVSAAAMRRVNEMKNSIHRTIATTGKEHRKAMLIDDLTTAELPVHSPQSFMGINVGGSMSGELFDEVNVYNGVVTLTFADAKTSRSSLREYDTQVAGFEHTNINLSPSQYARFLRADKAEVPCTLSRLEGNRVNAPESKKPDVNIVGDLSSVHTDPSYIAYVDAVALIEKGIFDKQYGGKGGLKRLAHDLEGIKVLFDTYLVETMGEKKKAVSKVLGKFQDEVIDYANREVESLPGVQQEGVKALLNKMATQLSALPNFIDKA